MMQFEVVYSEVFEVFLILRQLYSVERFKPFSNSLEAVSEDLSDDERSCLEDLGILSNGYLSALSSLISLYENESMNDSSLVNFVSSDPASLFIGPDEEINDELVLEKRVSLASRYKKKDEDRVNYGRLIRKIWSDGVCREKGKRSRWILGEMEKLMKFHDGDDLLHYLHSLSDRFELEKDRITFRIKPELSMKIDEIEKILVMPSLFASRKLTFWHCGKTLLFFLSAHSEIKSSVEPSDMHLLYSSALNDRNRLKILKMIASRNRTAGDLAGELELNASTVSRHLKLLKDAGFIEIDSNDGRQIIYSISQNGIKQAFESLEQFIMH